MSLQVFTVAQLRYSTQTGAFVRVSDVVEALAPVQQPGYDLGELPHHVSDLIDYAAKLQTQIEAVRFALMGVK